MQSAAIELDHLLWAAPDLDDGVSTIAGLTGVAPATGGSHPGFGTRNALLSLGTTYLEIIAPDPAQDLSDNRGGRIAGLPGPGLLTFAVRTPDLASFAAAARRAGLSVGAAIPMGRTRPDGLRLAWTVQQAASEAYPDLVPFAIDWQGAPHPAETTPRAAPCWPWWPITPIRTRSRRFTRRRACGSRCGTPPVPGSPPGWNCRARS